MLALRIRSPRAFTAKKAIPLLRVSGSESDSDSLGEILNYFAAVSWLNKQTQSFARFVQSAETYT
jgi:hypothetical protein